MNRQSSSRAQRGRRFRAPRRLKFTREGKYYVALTFGVGLVGVLTANNLLYVLLGMLLSLIVVSGILSESSLRKIRVTRRLPQRSQVGRVHYVEIQVRNDKKKMPSYAIEVEDLRQGQPADKRCFFLKVAPQSAQVAAYRRIPVRRGLDRHDSFRIATRFPFGLFEKSRVLESSGELIVYPGVEERRLPAQQHGQQDQGGSAASRLRGEEFFGIRLMRDGDDPRDIYWKRSTSGGPRVVIERSSEVRARVRLLLNDTVDSASPSLEEKKSFEARIRDTASLAVAHLRRGEEVRLKTTSGLSAAASPSSGADPILRFLALIRLESAQSDLERSSEDLASQEEHWLRENPMGEPELDSQNISIAYAPVQLSQQPQLSEKPSSDLQGSPVEEKS
ncbi:MAG: DUF58 domain-containing protein [Polyangiaceae bacterium]|nr:DUF58 domain-containing protein [Polyangiaceae bacterium]